MKKFYLTTPIYYSNDRPHVGTIYTSIAADVLARYYRASGFSVYFQTGVDEHGAKIAKAAELKKFKSPQDFVDHQAPYFEKPLQSLNISYDRFIRTTDQDHQTLVKKFLEKLEKRGEIYKGKYQGLYCLGCEEFKESIELSDGKCPLHNSVPQRIEEENYFFKLSKYQDKLISLIEKGKLKIEPETRKNEVLGFLKNEKLKDISISRQKVEWGISLPFDQKQTVYVWVDALLNYLSGGEKYWPADLHLIGRDILKFHAVIWPALLLANGYIPPKKIFAHGFFTLEGKKISKTFGNIIYADEVIKEYGPDAVRYFLLREIPFGKDGDFSILNLKNRYNADLANNLGNLVSRVAAMILKYYDGDLSQVKASKKDLKRFMVAEIWQKVEKSLKNLKFDEALVAIWELIARANRYIDLEKPWSEEEKRKIVLGNLVEVVGELSELILPFLPQTAEKIKKQFEGKNIGVAKPLFPRID